VGDYYRALHASLSPVTLAEDDGQELAKGALPPELIKVIREQMEEHRQRAMGWARMAYFDDALRELKLVETLFQSVNGRVTEPSRPGLATHYHLNNLHIDQAIHAMCVRAETYQQTVARFQFPEGTLSDFQVIPIPMPGYELCLAVVYTVRPASLTRKEITLDPAFYHETFHLPNSRSYVAFYSGKETALTIADTRFEEDTIYEVPSGYTPFYCRPPHGHNDRLFVSLTGFEDHVNTPVRGAMVFLRGRLCHLHDGPSQGPIIVLPARNDYHLNGLTYDGRYAFRRTEQGAVISRYRQEECHQKVLFESEQIIEILQSEQKDDAWTSSFKPDTEVTIDRKRAIELGELYALHGNMGRFALIRNEFSEPTELSFVSDIEHWKIRYGNPADLIISGVVTDVVIDKHGRLVSFHRMITPR